ncbi:MAG: quercetin dioxygenase-like cupin family protein [Saprospiraceae bacterium]|jgi:quercetin dioxygenase-like cupin family protein
MNTHQPRSTLKLPFQFNEEKLKRDLETLLASKWKPHFNQRVYECNWNSIALYAVGGDQSNIFAAGDKEIKETSLLHDVRYIKEVIDQFKCPLLSVRLLKLEKGAYIKPHRDYNLGYEDCNFRIHIPIVTNPDVNFTLDGERIEMKIGECWYTNVNYVHSVSNEGSTDRIHLVIDCERNEWTDKIFFSLAPRDSFLPNTEEEYSLETMKSIRNELLLMSADGAIEAIKDIDNKIEVLGE